VKNFIRTRDFFKIASALETGADHDMWSFQRYVKWLDSRTQWFIPDENPEPPDSEGAEGTASPTPFPAMPAPRAHRAAPSPSAKPSEAAKTGGRIEIEVDEGGLENILKKLK